MREIGIDRKVETIKVSDKEFTIGLIPIKAELLIAEHDRLNTEYDAKLKGVEDMLEVGNIVTERNLKCNDIIVSVLEAILKANGYEFDEDWWTSHVDYGSIVEIIAYVKAKDFIPSKKKVAKDE